jgi:hypothetical protein
LLVALVALVVEVVLVHPLGVLEVLVHPVKVLLVVMADLMAQTYLAVAVAVALVL